MKQLKGIFCAAGALLLLAGCQSDAPIEKVLQGRQIDYSRDETQQSRDLQYPPDLLSNVWRSKRGTVSLSEYSIAAIPGAVEEDVALEILAGEVAYRRDGNLRWVEVDLPPAQAWEATRLFWDEHLDFGLAEENPRIGTMETGWLDIRERIATPGALGDLVDDLLNRLNDTGQRDKFITRLERNDKGGSDLFISHRHVAANFDGDGKFTGFTGQGSETQLEVEMLRRLMLYLAKRNVEEDNSAIDQQVAAAESPANADYELTADNLLIKKPFEESWQLVQVALNRGGFSIEDRDYDKGEIYIRHSGGPDSDKIFGKKKEGLFNFLFGDDEPVLRIIKLTLNKTADNAAVNIVAGAVEDEEEFTPKQTATTLELVHQYLP